MQIIFKKLSPDLCTDFMYYFDHVAFTDNKEFSMCYCLESHVTKQEDEALSSKESRRAKAIELINCGIMQGYLLYEDNKVIGWCNTGDKASYCAVMDEEHTTVDLKNHKVKVIYCIEIAPAYRGKGLAHLIVDKVCEDAKAEGYEFVEGYPFLDRDFAYQYHGPIRLFEKHSFERVADRSWFCIMSKKL